MRRLRSLASVLALAVGLTACSAAPAPDTAPTPGSGPLVAFYGDSYTLGTGASDASKRWSTIISASRGWREFNPSVNGLGFVNQRTNFGDDDLPALIIEAEPDIVFVTMGLNDNFSFDRRAELIRATITEDLTRLRDALPSSRLIVVEPFWYAEQRPESVETIIAWVEDAAAAVDADWIPGASRWLDGHYAGSADSWMASDELHPSDIGYRHIAEQMDAALAQLDPPL
ncbi:MULTISPECIES: SGNH/GDSL hydrolase family protein [unclassified Microbacterium]|uniref:SGNH/GDSL hydrolase family protein n=1 Tax=unclassified Microbacterium TaxID=2609290 RepID=UPI000EA9F920|nr:MULTISPECIES: SGNH/GDSL hydrolase family protein [unclassified Microbacterium]MBT2485508.1 SGNH/GDSL hydrolase family protein [Microbacterium sp. ISL-108]RKN68298.1 SGNH/GDSL hydrolase family protein [Microbacterium sp. CGR2]